jgi:hypothetical protein
LKKSASAGATQKLLLLRLLSGHSKTVQKPGESKVFWFFFVKKDCLLPRFPAKIARRYKIFMLHRKIQVAQLLGMTYKEVAE